jgi:hypothetical protein
MYRQTTQIPLIPVLNRGFLPSIIKILSVTFANGMHFLRYTVNHFLLFLGVWEVPFFIEIPIAMVEWMPHSIGKGLNNKAQESNAPFILSLLFFLFHDSLFPPNWQQQLNVQAFFPSNLRPFIQ